MTTQQRNTKRGKYSNWNSREGKEKIKQSVNKWLTHYKGKMRFQDYAKNEGIPITTLRQYCCNDPTKRKSIDNVKEKKLIKAHEREIFVKLVSNKPPSEAIQIIQKRYKLTSAQATHQYYRYGRNAHTQRKPGQQSRSAQPNGAGSLVFDIETPTPPQPQSYPSLSQQVLVYQIPNPTKWDTHPFRKTKGCTKPELAFNHTDIQYEVEICDGDLLQCLRNLHKTPHGTMNVACKNACSRKMKDAGVKVISIGSNDVCAKFDHLSVYRNGSSEVSCVMMSETLKSNLLHHLLDASYKNLRIKSSRDVGDRVVRFDCGYTQGFSWCKKYVDANNNALIDTSPSSKSNLYHIPGVLKGTCVLNSMSVDLKKAIAQVLLRSQEIVKDGFPNAFKDQWRSELVHDNLWKDSFDGVDILSQIKWEYIGIIAREVGATDLLAMHLDGKNDRRDGYEHCATYSFIHNGYRITIVMASKQDWGSLMERVRKVEVKGGKFI